MLLIMAAYGSLGWGLGLPLAAPIFFYHRYNGGYKVREFRFCYPRP